MNAAQYSLSICSASPGEVRHRIPRTTRRGGVPGAREQVLRENQEHPEPVPCSHRPPAGSAKGSTAPRPLRGGVLRVVDVLLPAGVSQRAIGGVELAGLVSMEVAFTGLNQFRQIDHDILGAILACPFT